MKYRRLVLKEFNEVILEEYSLPDPKQDELLVQMQAAAINPADLTFIQGKYGIQPSLPSLLGFDGAGKVIACGSQVKGFKTGDLVLAPKKVGSWCEAFLAKPEELIVCHPAPSIEQASMLSINPPTAWRMLHDYVPLKTGDWIIQNAANSNVGRAVIDIAKAKGWKTWNIVRRKELIPELEEAGGTTVVTEGTPITVKSHLGFNTVGGESASSVARGLASHGTLVTYGAMARKPLTIENSLLIFKDIRFVGFWRTQWMEQASRQEIEEMFKQLCELCLSGYLNPPIEKKYRLEEYREALTHASQTERSGKILFTM